MKKIFTLFCISLVLCSCKKEEPDPKPILLTSFPMVAGHAWKYHTLQTNIVDSVPSFSYYDSRWVVMHDTVINSIPCTKMMQQPLYEGMDTSYYRAYIYYAMDDSGIYKIARNYQGQIFHFKNEFSGPAGLGFADEPFTTTTTELYLFSPQPRLMKFPSAPDDVWDANESTTPYKKRKWLGYETITTKAGTFDCIKMQVITDINDDGFQDEHESIIYQYFSEKGLIRESVYSHFLFGINQSSTLVQNTDLMEVNF